jgi:hypothetical protein
MIEGAALMVFAPQLLKLFVDGTVLAVLDEIWGDPTQLRQAWLPGPDVFDNLLKRACMLL